jgi:hypothetical protein
MAAFTYVMIHAGAIATAIATLAASALFAWVAVLAY